MNQTKTQSSFLYNYTKIIGKFIFYNYFALRLKFHKQYKYIFILSHMRSGSTLLTHLLNSNSEILGYGETHLGYSNTKDLKILVYKVLFNLKRFIFIGKERYILDKLLHNNLLDPKNISYLNFNDIKFIFLLRQPESSIASAINNLNSNEADSLKYYKNRLAHLEEYAKNISDKRKCLYFTYDELIYNTKMVLNAIKKFLDLKEPLEENYKTINKTGIPGVGDFSENIFTGKIIRGEKNKKAKTKLNINTINVGNKFFQQYTTTLRKHCNSVQNFNFQND